MKWPWQGSSVYVPSDDVESDIRTGRVLERLEGVTHRLEEIATRIETRLNIEEHHAAPPS